MEHAADAGGQSWNQAYQYNLRLYNAKVHSYKNGNPDAKDMDDSEALRYADEVGIAMPVTEDPSANDQDAIAEQLQGTSADAQGEPEETPPPKGKKAGGRKRKSEVEDVATPAATPASPAQKRRRASTKPAEEKEEPKKGRKKGKNA